MTEARATTCISSSKRRRTALAAALLAWLGAPLFSPAAAQEREHGGGPGFTWEASPGLAATARHFQGEVGPLLEEARRWTGLPPDSRPIQLVWVGSREELAQALGEPVPDWYAAVALPEQRRLILATQVAGTESRLRATLRHELMHLAMADMGPEGYARLPAWFHEGCAEVFAGDIYLGDLGVSLAWRAFAGDLEPLSDFDEGFGRETVRAAVGYAQGQAFVARLRREYGARIVPALLQRVAAGASLDQALLAETDLSLVTHELKMRAALSSPLALLTDFYPQMFFLLALALLVAFPFIRAARRRRRRELEQRWEREEQRERSDPVLASGQWRQPGPERPEGEDPEAVDWWEEEK